MSEQPPVLSEVDARGVATVTLNRPQVNNAYDGAMVQALLEGARALGADERVRAVVIRGAGRHFQAGADLNWLESVRTASAEENLRVSQATTDAVRTLDAMPKPTVALVHGACFGGGTGIVAACDVVLAEEGAVFSIAEARWGLHAGPIIPQLNAAMGPRNVRRYALTGERFDAAKAAMLGLVHEVVANGALDAALAPILDGILKNGPAAVAETKRIVFEEAGLAIDDARAVRLARSHADKRMSEEGAEGLLSFREKREARWYPG